jgi:hypothetical protein
MAMIYTSGRVLRGAAIVRNPLRYPQHDTDTSGIALTASLNPLCQRASHWPGLAGRGAMRILGRRLKRAYG